jgi:hypothetical protein
MAEAQSLQLGALQLRNGTIERSLYLLRDRLGETLGHDQDVTFDVVGRVVEFRMEGNGQVRRDRPRRRGPDQDGNVMAGQCRHAPAKLVTAVRCQRELDVD